MKATKRKRSVSPAIGEDYYQNLAWRVIQDHRRKLRRSEDIDGMDMCSDTDTGITTASESPLACVEQITDEVMDNNIFYASEAGEDVGKENVPVEVLSLLGRNTGNQQELGPEIHQEVAVRWTEILTSGLQEKTADDILQKYPPVVNCKVMGAPKLNPEVEAALSDQHLKRDARIAAVQNRLGAALSAIGNGLTTLLKEGGGETNLPLIELLSDAGRLVADAHHQESDQRRFLVGTGLNKLCRDTIAKAPIGECLFGENLGERMKAAKALERSSVEMKAPRASSLPPKIIDRTGNSKGLFRAGPKLYRSRPVGPRQKQTRDVRLTNQPRHHQVRQHQYRSTGQSRPRFR